MRLLSIMAAPCLVSTRNSERGSITARVAPLPRSASNSASGAAFIAVKKAGTALSRAVSGKHDTAITMSEPIARSAFSMLRTPPSMYRSPFIVIGGQIPGTAVLAANARSNGAPEDASHTLSFPVRAFTVVARNWFGQGCPTKGANIALEMDASSLIVCALSAILPIAPAARRLPRQQRCRLQDLRSQDRFPDQRNRASSQFPKPDLRGRRHQARVPATGDLERRPYRCQLSFSQLLHCIRRQRRSGSRRFTKRLESIGIGRCAYIRRNRVAPAQVLFLRSGYVQREWV